MTTALRVSEDELRRFLVSRLEIMDAADFDKACRMAARLRIPLERAVVERGRIPLGFLLAQLAETWGIDYIDLKVNDVKPEALGVLTEEYARARVLVPFALDDRLLRVAMWNPRDRRNRPMRVPKTTVAIIAARPPVAFARAGSRCRPDI